MGHDIEYTSQPNDGGLTLSVYTGCDGAFTLYEDDGISYDYEKGSCARIPFVWDETAKTLTLGARRGAFEGMTAVRPIDVRFITPDGTHTQKTTYDGQAQALKLN